MKRNIHTAAVALAVTLSSAALSSCDETARTQPLSNFVKPTADDKGAKAAPAATAPAAEPSLADTEIRAAILHALALDGSGLSQRTDVGVEQGVATLKGTLDHLLARDRANDLRTPDVAIDEGPGVEGRPQ